VTYALCVLRTPSLRASDSDRDQAAERLRHATAEGRLTAQELEDRLEVLYRTRTYGELDALVADLPVSTSAQAVRLGVPRWVGATGALIFLLAALGILLDSVRHSTGVVVGPGPVGRAGLRAEPLVSHHLMIAAVSRVAVFALLVLCVVLIWLLMRASDASRTG
jgi:hypothetical protein